MTKKEFSLNQIELQERIQSLANVNVVNCGHCGDVMFHDMNIKKIECGCGFSSNEPGDFPDYWCQGQEYYTGITERELRIAQKFLSGDEDEVKEMIISIRAHKDENDLIDYLDYVTPCEDFEFTFTVKAFRNLITN